MDGIGLLAGSEAWNAADQRGMEEWFGAFLGWLTTSELGKGESHSLNNHGTYYDVQVVALALFLGDRELAETVVRRSMDQRIPAQFQRDGRQPLELELVCKPSPGFLLGRADAADQARRTTFSEFANTL